MIILIHTTSALTPMQQFMFTKENMDNNTYYILITSLEEYTDKLHNMLQILSNQIETYSTSNVESTNIRILVCNDNIETHKKKKKCY